MRKPYRLFAAYLLMFACNEVLGLDPGVPIGSQGVGGVSSEAMTRGGSPPTPSFGGTINGGTDATSSGRAGSPPAGAASDDPAPSGGDAGRSGGEAGAGDGGRGGDACASTADCIERGFSWPPHLCLRGACVDILADDCDRVVGAEWLEDHPGEPPFVFGSITQHRSTLDPTYFSLKLAMREFMQHGAVPIGGVELRPVLLLCHAPPSTPTLVPRILDHLIDHVGASGLLMLTNRHELMASVQYALVDKKADAFLLDYGGQAREVNDGGHVWHMLGDAFRIAVSFNPLVERVEEHVNPGASSGHGARLTRLVIIPPAYDDGFESIIALHLEDVLRTNGTWLREHPNSYRMISVKYRFIDAVVAEVAGFEPSIVIDFNGMQSEIDAAMRNMGAPPPFYILPPSQAHSKFLIDRVASDPSLRTRLAGLNHAGPVDTTLYDAYIERFEAVSPGIDASQSANVYDAVYFLIYSAVGGGTGGKNMLAGMQRLLAGPQRNVGPADIGSVLEFLRSDTDTTLSLHGALGPPDFDTSHGSPDRYANVWCINERLKYVMDALRFTPIDLMEGKADLEGTFPCFDL